MILIIDNYDSFVHNLARYFAALKCDTHIVRNDVITFETIRFLNPRAIVISPGPNGPSEAGICCDIIKEFHKTIPILGVCLGHQCIAQSFGATVQPSMQPVHGMATTITHNNSALFKNIPSPFSVGRYHSLIVVINSETPLKVTAQANDNTIMAIEHTDYPVYGVQFHPESILTEHGITLLQNFLDIAGKHAA